MPRPSRIERAAAWLAERLELPRWRRELAERFARLEQLGHDRLERSLARAHHTQPGRAAR